MKTADTTAVNADMLMIRITLQKLEALKEFELGLITEVAVKGRLSRLNKQAVSLGVERGFTAKEENKK